MADFDKQTEDQPSSMRRPVDWSGQDEFWRDNYGARPYTKADRSYE